MQTSIDPALLADPRIAEAEEILRSCVHCGFCLATCPTYQLLGDELDSPRGRIYQIKSVLEGEPVTESVQRHLDRCLGCRSCETTCPSGVRYATLLDTGRALVEARQPRTVWQQVQRNLLLGVLPYRARITPLMRTGQWVRGLLPGALKAKVPPRQPLGEVPPARHQRRVVLLQGCVQPAMAPEIDTAAQRVADWVGISLVSATGAGCCGALPQHLSAVEQAEAMARRNIDAWWPEISAGAEAVVSTASGCGLMLSEYDHLLAHDVDYAAQAARISALQQDPLTLLAAPLQERLDALEPSQRRALQASIDASGPVAFQAPCTLQHGLGLAGAGERVLSSLGVTLCPVKDAHLCCGSAGTYSIFQPEISQALRDDKLQQLSAAAPKLILTANIGCLLHLAEASATPVRHWLVQLDHWLTAAGLYDHGSSHTESLDTKQV